MTLTDLPLDFHLKALAGAVMLASIYALYRWQFGQSELREEKRKFLAYYREKDRAESENPRRRTL